MSFRLLSCGHPLNHTSPTVKPRRSIFRPAPVLFPTGAKCRQYDRYPRDSPPPVRNAAGLPASATTSLTTSCASAPQPGSWLQQGPLWPPATPVSRSSPGLRCCGWTANALDGPGRLAAPGQRSRSPDAARLVPRPDHHPRGTARGRCQRTSGDTVSPHLTLDPDDPTPPYEQLRRQLADLITAGQLCHPGTGFPRCDSSPETWPLPSGPSREPTENSSKRACSPPAAVAAPAWPPSARHRPQPDADSWQA